MRKSRRSGCAQLDLLLSLLLRPISFNPAPSLNTLFSLRFVNIFCLVPSALVWLNRMRRLDIQPPSFGTSVYIPLFALAYDLHRGWEIFYRHNGPSPNRIVSSLNQLTEPGHRILLLIPLSDPACIPSLQGTLLTPPITAQGRCPRMERIYM